MEGHWEHASPLPFMNTAEKIITNSVMHHWLDGHEFESAPGVGKGQGGLACCRPWGRKESDTTEQLNWFIPSPEYPPLLSQCAFFCYKFVSDSFYLTSLTSVSSVLQNSVDFDGLILHRRTHWKYVWICAKGRLRRCFLTLNALLFVVLITVKKKKKGVINSYVCSCTFLMLCRSCLFRQHDVCSEERFYLSKMCLFSVGEKPGLGHLTTLIASRPHPSLAACPW